MKSYYSIFKAQNKAFITLLFVLLMLGMGNMEAYAQSTPPEDAAVITLHTRNNADIRLDLFASENSSTIWVECSPGSYTVLTVHSSWTGPQDFKVQGNTLKVYGNIKHFDCGENGGMLLGLDVSQNPDIVFLYCYWTDIVSLDVSNNPKLEKLYCSYTPLTALDLSNNPRFNYLNGYGSSMESLNMRNGNNQNVQFFRVTSNPYLECIQVDDGFVPPSSWEKDADAEWNNDFDHPCQWWLSVEDNSMSVNTFSIYPNPAKTQVRIETDNLDANSVIEIFDLSGKCVCRQAVRHYISTVDVSMLPKGMYVVKLNQAVEKLMIQ